MLEILLFTLNSILPIILIMGVGYGLKQINFFSKDFLKYGNKTVFYLCLPVLLFKNIADINDISEIRMDVVLYTLIVIAVLFVIGYVISMTTSDPKQKGVLHQCIFRSNFALIGVPLAELMGGSNGVRTAAILSLFTIPVFNILAVFVLSVYRDGKVKINIKNILVDIIKNPLIEGVLLGLLVALIKTILIRNDVSLPFSRVSFINTAISYIARSATPLALLVLGGQFELKKIAGYKKSIIIGLFGRNILAPLLGVGVAGVLTLTNNVSFGNDVFAALIALFGTPVAVASAIMAEAMDNDGQLASQLVVWTTLVSIITLFITIFTARAFNLL